mgnify:CR=1 FL=1
MSDYLRLAKKIHIQKDITKLLILDKTPIIIIHISHSAVFTKR